jgi:Flp pilus assembly pilin Flp
MSEITITTNEPIAPLEDQSGQTMAEYGVVLTVITIGIVTAFALFATRIELSILRVVKLIP